MNFFGRPGIARARDLTPRAANSEPDVVVHELTEAAGWQAAAVSGALDVIHGFGRHRWAGRRRELTPIRRA